MVSPSTQLLSVPRNDLSFGFPSAFAIAAPQSGTPCWSAFASHFLHLGANLRHYFRLTHSSPLAMPVINSLWFLFDVVVFRDVFFQTSALLVAELSSLLRRRVLRTGRGRLRASSHRSVSENVGASTARPRDLPVPADLHALHRPYGTTHALPVTRPPRIHFSKLTSTQCRL